MNETKPPRTFLPWEELRVRLDEGPHFNTMRGTPYYRDAVYEQFSAAEYARRYAALRAKMREHRLDAVIVPGGPSHWSFGGGMLWLTGHWEWHALACYVVVRGGRYAEVMADRIVELGLERGRIGLLEIDPRHRDYMPVNQYDTLRKRLPDAELVLTVGFIHELLSVHSAEELDCVRVAGKLCENAMNAMLTRAEPGVTEYELRAAAGAAILEGGGDIDFLIIGTTPMANPAMVFGNPRPSGRRLARGDIINMEIAAGYRGYTAQIGSPICLGPPTDTVRRFWDEITLPAFRNMAAEIRPGTPVEAIRAVGEFFRQKGVQSRPIHAHGIDLVTDGPHVFTDGVHGEAFEQIFRPGMVFMAEPNPITADGNFGIFLGHTFIVTETGSECVDAFPWDLVVV